MTHDTLASANMGLSLSVTDILKLFRDRRIVEKQQVAEFLAEIAVEASEVAGIWTEAYRRLEVGGILAFANATAIARLRRYYQRASTVLDNRVTQGELDDILEALGGLLVTRDRLFDAAERFPQLIASDNEDCVQKTKDDIRTFIQELHNSAADLHVLAKAVKSQ